MYKRTVAVLATNDWHLLPTLMLDQQFLNSVIAIMAQQYS